MQAVLLKCLLSSIDKGIDFTTNKLNMDTTEEIKGNSRNE